eukprot:scaffold20058_cov51-Attheya_sp.AAC.1
MMMRRRRRRRRRRTTAVKEHGAQTSGNSAALVGILLGCHACLVGQGRQILQVHHSQLVQSKQGPRQEHMIELA